MTVREAFLFAVLIVLGVTGFRQERERSAQRLAGALERERELAAEIQRLDGRRRELRAEAIALNTDTYYVERMARLHLGWRPVEEPAGAPADVPTREGPPGALVRNVPGPAPPPPAPVAPRPGPAEHGRQFLAVLGYRSVEHFQRKMMPGRATGELDAPTCQRAGHLVAMLQVLGFGSVKAFQERHGLRADGIFGRRSEERAIALLQAQQPSGRRQGPAGVVVHNGDEKPDRPDG
jgi:hypothetical protein